MGVFAVVLFHTKEGSHISALEGAMPDWLKFLISNGKLGAAVFLRIRDLSFAVFALADGACKHRLLARLILSLWYGFLIGVFAYWFWRNWALAPLFFAANAIILWFANGNQFAFVCSITSCALWICAVPGTIHRGLNL